MRPLLPILLLILITSATRAQISAPFKRGNFGIEGELRANYFNGIDLTSDDWFNNDAGTGVSIIDTTGAAYIRQLYQTNPATRLWPLFRSMSYPQFSIINNNLLVDAVFIRDHHGQDSTVFASGSNKNGMSPADWTSPVAQGIPDKNDILDMFMHVRRAGPNDTDSLWFFGGLSLEKVGGNRYFDFEMYQTDINYQRSTLSFKGYGPDAGHTSWQFDAAGHVTQAGDIIFTAEYGGSGLSLIEARIWVNNSTLSITPTDFSWGGDFIGAVSGAAYGYANILPKDGSPFYTGITNSGATWAGPFGLVRVDNSLVPDYLDQQFMEFSVNLTKLGIDPLVNVGDPCKMPFRRILVKSRSSSSFNSELKDFVGPFDFFRAPMAGASANIPIFCGSAGVSTISVDNPLITSLYTWTTPDGHIVGDSIGPSITVNQPGMYIVSQQLMDSCGTSYAKDTVTVTLDVNCSILATNMQQFSARLVNKTALLSWTVSNHTSALYYEVERSYDNVHFSQVSRINATDKTSLVVNYHYQDELAAAKANMIFYRIKTVDEGGRTSFSKTVVVNVQEERNKILLMPNPVINNAQLLITGQLQETVSVSVMDVSGKVVRMQKVSLSKGATLVDINNIGQWPRGTYFVKVMMGGQLHTQKMVLVR